MQTEELNIFIKDTDMTMAYVSAIINDYAIELSKLTGQDAKEIKRRIINSGDNYYDTLKNLSANELK